MRLQGIPNWLIVKYQSLLDFDAKVPTNTQFFDTVTINTGSGFVHIAQKEVTEVRLD